MLFTATAAEVVYIEAALLPGGSGVSVTGTVHQAVEDQVRAARSFIWSCAGELGIHPRLLRRSGLHVHVPLDADHAAAGLAIVVTLVSVYTGCAVAADTAVTGGATLTGLVLPVSAIRERVLAARRAGWRTVIVPRDNEKELEGWTDAEPVISLVCVDNVRDALPAALPQLTRHLAALKPSL